MEVCIDLLEKEEATSMIMSQRMEGFEQSIPSSLFIHLDQVCNSVRRIEDLIDRALTLHSVFPNQPQLIHELSMKGSYICRTRDEQALLARLFRQSNNSNQQRRRSHSQQGREFGQPKKRTFVLRCKSPNPMIPDNPRPSGYPLDLSATLPLVHRLFVSIDFDNGSHPSVRLAMSEGEMDDI